MTVTVAAVDLGATSGRVMLGHVGPDELRLEAVARFPNTPVETIDGLHWNILELYRSIVEGLRAAAQTGDVAAIGIDSWAVDYALLRGGRMLGTPYHYRDARTAAGVDAVHAVAPFEELYGENGLQFLAFNTLYQLAADRIAGTLDLADEALLIPDLIAYWLTGEKVAESTNASTTGLLRVGGGDWNRPLAESLGIPSRLLPTLVQPGHRIGTLRDAVRTATGLDAPVIAVGSHDTASAVAAIPMTDPDAAYISCGTWGLVGVELDAPVLTEASRAANFTNEGGVDGRVRFLHNVMGLWLLSESVRAWERESGETIDLPALLAEAAAVEAPQPVFDANDPVFTAPGGMPDRIASWLSERGLAVPQSRAAFARCIVESLASAFADAVHAAAELSGKRVNAIHLVGGGSLNELLCQLTADRAGLPVLAGPVEATALGNVLVQARALGEISGSLEDLRELVARTTAPRRFAPRA
ncbi:rhamnulokinase [Microbacterium sp. JZ101]